MKRAGAARSLAAILERVQPDIFAVCEIDAGDALAMATRFVLQWGYRGGQALFWRPELRAGPIRDAYLPYSPMRPFERRGMVGVDLQIGAREVALLATQIGAQRDQRIREWRSVRTTLRTVAGAAVVFCVLPAGKVGLEDLGFVRAGCRGVDDECIFARGLEILEAGDDTSPHRGIGATLVARLRTTGTV